MACTGCVRVLELCILGMDHLRRFLRLHGEPVSGDDDDLKHHVSAKLPARGARAAMINRMLRRGSGTPRPAEPLQPF